MIYFNKKPKREKCFFFIFVEWWSAPSVKHSWLWKAKEEAQRLVKKTGNRTYILQCVKSYELEETIYVT